MKRILVLACGLAAMAACGGGGGGGGYTPPPSPPSIYVSISPSTQGNIDQGQTVKFTATVENDSSNQGVKWTVAATGVTGAARGTVTNTTSTSATYVAPATVSAGLSVTVSATSIADGTKSSSSVVMVSPSPGITTTTLPNATPNASYSVTLQAAGGSGTLTWSLASGALPAGLSLSSAGAITEQPTASGTSNFTVQVTDTSSAAEGPAIAQAKLSLTVVTPVSITTTALPDGAESSAYSASIAASGGTPPYTWSVVSGSLPPGLTLQPSTGAVSGTPTSEGTYTVTVSAQDSSPTKQTQSQSLPITVSAAPLIIVTKTLPHAVPNTNYSVTLQATGGLGTLTWSLVSGTLPTGLSLSSSGVIAGDPTVSGSFPFTVQVTDQSTGLSGPNTKQAPLSINVVSLLSIVNEPQPSGAEGVAYLADYDAGGGTPPYTWSVAAGSLPPGLAMIPNSGVISGTPTSSGKFTFTLEAKDSSSPMQSATLSVALTIAAPGPLTITTSSLLDGTKNTHYTAGLVAMGGTPPYTWSIPVGAMPAGVTLNASTGQISGTPSSTGTANLTVMVKDSSATKETQTQELSLVVNNPPQACTSSGNNAALSGPYVFSLSGFNAAGFLTVVGAFTANGAGKITAGEADSNGVLGAQTGSIITSSSSYSVGPDNRGCATLATPFGTFVTHFALGSMSSSTATGGRMIEWDSPSASAYIATGQLLRQDSSSFAAGLNGSYVFHNVGWDYSTLGGRDACVGQVSAGGNTFYAMEQDCNDAMTVSTTGAPDEAGSYTALDSNGRGTGILALMKTNTMLTFYAVSSSQLLVVNADSSPFLSGEWDLQSVPSAGFTAASLKGNMVFSLNGLSLVGTATAVSMETATADGTSLMTIKFYEDRAGAVQGSSTYTCAYAVESNGRVSLSSTTQGCGGTPPVFYLTGLNTGIIVDASPGVDTGTFEPQTAGPFGKSSLSGAYFGGMPEVAIQCLQSEVDPVAPNGSGSITGTTETTSTSTQDSGSSFLAASYNVNSDGTFSVSSSGGNVAGVIISATKFVMFSPSTFSTSFPTLLVMQK